LADIFATWATTVATIVATVIVAPIFTATGDAITVWTNMMMETVPANLRVAVAAVGGGSLRAHWDEGEGHDGGQECIFHGGVSYPSWDQSVRVVRQLMEGAVVGGTTRTTRASLCNIHLDEPTLNR
jgi:hypothetical protein